MIFIDLFAINTRRETDSTPSIWKSFVARMRGPGGYYNIGNAVGLVTGLVLAISVQGSLGLAVHQFLMGSYSALALTLATVIFMFSGEAYHHAWAGGFPPIKYFNFKGDLLSGFGALVLGVGLLMLGQPVLAATSGHLHAAGKFGSAFHKPQNDAAFDWCYFFRQIVLASRAPAMLAAVIEVWRLVGAGAGTASLITPLSLLLCYCLWAKADWMLFPKRVGE